ncbi:MAG: hypothetical protein LBK82_16895 [Planctomycetaceae bacterium]|nr:hypothetical protein [Planctomycetaceae bacterium]
MGDPPAGRSRRLSFHFTVIKLIHCRLTPTATFQRKVAHLIVCPPYGSLT